ncbi:unnamed protein product [Phytophthora lilii]|uniref:Unnamed protein product n=1 Tax=Phytophthora lilii TaxID=2077276 RepID=A0A9W6TDL4_9STRA|nr:unnamed protein product [Phytophthora lilii]
MSQTRTQRFLGFLKPAFIGRVDHEHDAMALAVVFVPNSSQTLLQNSSTSAAFTPVAMDASYLSSEVPEDDPGSPDIHSSDCSSSSTASSSTSPTSTLSRRTVEPHRGRDLVQRDARLLAEDAFKLLQQRLSPQFRRKSGRVLSAPQPWRHRTHPPFCPRRPAPRSADAAPPWRLNSSTAPRRARTWRHLRETMQFL